MKVNKKNRTVKFFKWVCVSMLVFTVLCSGLLAGTMLHYSKTIPFSRNSLLKAYTHPTYFDVDGNEIAEFETDNLKANVADLSPHTVDAVLSIEDKSFYKHKGINYKRTFKALLINLKERRIKEGGSTISQQLVKNTFLTNEKTLERKLKEASVVFKLEKNCTKDEILEIYLNTAYFGRGAYGLENAAHIYFNKPASELNLNESATLASVLSAPSFYAKAENKDKLIRRRNLVLSEMKKDKKISADVYEEEIGKGINFAIQTKLNYAVAYKQAVVNEVCKNLNMSADEFYNSRLKVYTNFDRDAQEVLESSQMNIPKNALNASVLIDNETGKVLAFCGQKNQALISRSSGSLLKPLLVYAPGFEENVLTPQTFISDEPVAFDGFIAQNFNKTNDGDMSVKNAIAKSSNVVAVKALNYLGLDNVEKYAHKLDIDIGRPSLALSLGATESGQTLLEIASGFACIARGGEHIKPSFVASVESDAGVVYNNSHEKTRVFGDDTSFLVTDCLKEAAQVGTASRLKNLPFEVASKTGTSGLNNTSKNTDCYNASYTTKHTLITWLGSKNNKEENLLASSVSGANIPTDINKNILSKLYKKSRPKNFVVPRSVELVELDSLELAENNLVVANDKTPDRYKVKAYFKKNNIPRKISQNFVSVLAPAFNTAVVDDKVSISFTAKPSLVYELYKNDNLIKVIKIPGEFRLLDEVKSDEVTVYKLIAMQINYGTGSTVISKPYEKIVYLNKELKNINEEVAQNLVNENEVIFNVFNTEKQIVKERKRNEIKKNQRFDITRFIKLF